MKIVTMKAGEERAISRYLDSSLYVTTARHYHSVCNLFNVQV